MADISITATGVLKGTTAQISPTNGTAPAFVEYLAAVTITAGQALYADDSVNPPVWRLAQCDGTAAESRVAGIALNGAAAGQPVKAQTAGPITIGATLADGGLYVLSATAGGICLIHDLLATNRISVIGFSSSAALLQVRLWNTEKALAADIT